MKISLTKNIMNFFKCFKREETYNKWRKCTLFFVVVLTRLKILLIVLNLNSFHWVVNLSFFRWISIAVHRLLLLLLLLVTKHYVEVSKFYSIEFRLKRYKVRKYFNWDSYIRDDDNIMSTRKYHKFYIKETIFIVLQ